MRVASDMGSLKAGPSQVPYLIDKKSPITDSEAVTVTAHGRAPAGDAAQRLGLF
jgi:hypothetical protein